MEVRRLGKDGPAVGVIGLGTEHLERSQEMMAAVLGATLEAGVECCPSDVDIMAKLDQAVVLFEGPFADERRS